MFSDFLSLMFTAALMTLGLAVCSLLLGLFLSLIFAVLEANRFVGKPMTVFVALLRGLPEIIVVLLVYFGSTELVEMLTGEYIEFGAFGCGVFALSLILQLMLHKHYAVQFKPYQKDNGNQVQR